MNDTAEASVERFAQRLGVVRDEIGKVVVGQREVVDGVLTCLLASGHVLLEGVPGLGKTVLVRTLAQCLDLRFSRIQFTPDMMPADILGTQVIREGDGSARHLDFQPGPIFAHIVLADEINRTTPKTQSALLEAMQEHSVTVAKTTHILDEPFFVLGTQNPLEMEGTYPLPEAQLDRFLFKLHVDFPSHDDLHAILSRTLDASPPTASAVMDRQEVLALRRTVAQVAVADHVREYVVQILEATHPERTQDTELVKRFVRFGASPRGAQACLVAAKVRALMDGRPHVAAEDVRRVALPALRHRLILNFEGEAEGMTPDAILTRILDTVKPGG